MLFTIFGTVISITAFSVTKKPQKSQAGPRQHYCGSQTDSGADKLVTSFDNEEQYPTYKVDHFHIQQRHMM